uniref:Frizzled-4 n=1 Tax=Acrobeloides nanus TaxID=290746 RepID=A0A914CWY9_9BILA
MHRSNRQANCQRITTAQCQGIGYNETKFPNFVGDEQPETAAEVFSTFEPLISVKCSPHLRFFLCSVYFPMCTEKVPDPIGPCRPLCERVRDDCIPVLKDFSYPWPDALECSKFPQNNNDHQMCMPGPLSDENEVETKTQSSNEQTSNQEPENLYEIDPRKYVLSGARCSLPSLVYINRTAQCVPKCNSSKGYNINDISSARDALIIASIISAGLTFVCLLFSCVRQMPVPFMRKPIEKSLFFCTLCFAFSSAVYLFSLFEKDRVACMDYNGHSLFVVPGVQHVPCTLLATLLYYFGTAGRLWWLILCCSWRWCLKDHTNSESEHFIFRSHVFAWATPLVIITLALMAQSIHADPLANLCMVGGSSRIQHQVFVSLRELVLFFGSLLPLASGCLTSVHSNQPNGSGHNSGAGLIGVLYPVAAAFWLIASIQYLFNPNSYGWNIVSAFKLLADPTLGINIWIIVR